MKHCVAEFAHENLHDSDMIQKQQKAPNIYALFSGDPTAMLTAATRELFKAVKAGHVNEPIATFEYILGLIRTRSKIDELPFVQMGSSAQESLINSLASCLNPAEVSFKSSGSLQRDAKTRLLILDALMAIEDIHSDTHGETPSSLDKVGPAIPEIIVHDMADSHLIESYHERLKGWPPFVEHFGDKYEAALDKLYQISIRRGHCDEMTMGWVRTAKRELHTVQFMGLNGKLPKYTAG